MNSKMSSATSLDRLDELALPRIAPLHALHEAFEIDMLRCLLLALSRRSLEVGE